MEQKDYLLREIEKIGIVLRSILGNLLNRKENLSIEFPNPFEQTKERLISEIDFHLDEFLLLDETATKAYIQKIKGLNASNLELMAELLFQFGLSGEAENKGLYLEKARQLYEFCSYADRTFSLPREKRIREINNKF
jgi:hypothetical protein